MKAGGRRIDRAHVKAVLKIPDEVEKLIEKQVEAFNFSLDYIENHYKMGESDLIVRFQKGKVGILKGQENFKDKAIVGARCRFISEIVEKAHEEHGVLGGLDLVIPMCFSDKSNAAMQHIPCLAFSKEAYSNNILIPSLNNLGSYPEFEYVDMEDLPLFHKHDKMCFAGSVTNIACDGYGIQENQRLKVAEMAAYSPDHFYCDVIMPPGFDEEEWGEVKKDIFSAFPALKGSKVFKDVESRTALATQFRYKYQVCVDGHVSSWARLPWQLKSNSVVLKIRNRFKDYIEWYYPLLENGTHFLEMDIDSLMDVYVHLREEPEQQMSLCENASAFVDKYISVEMGKNVFLYTLLLLNEKQTLILKDLGEDK